MAAVNEVTLPQLSRIVGFPGAPRLLDMRAAGDVRLDPFGLPAARHLDPLSIAS